MKTNILFYGKLWEIEILFYSNKQHHYYFQITQKFNWIILFIIFMIQQRNSRWRVVIFVFNCFVSFVLKYAYASQFHYFYDEYSYGSQIFY